MEIDVLAKYLTIGLWESIFITLDILLMCLSLVRLNELNECKHSFLVWFKRLGLICIFVSCGSYIGSYWAETTMTLEKIRQLMFMFGAISFLMVVAVPTQFEKTGKGVK